MASRTPSLPLLRLVRQGSSRFDRQLLLLIALSGLTNALLLAIVNNAAANAENNAASGTLLVYFSAVFVSFIVAQRTVLRVSVSEVERILDAIRVRLSARISESTLPVIEKLGRGRIYASMQRETETISQAAGGVTIAAQSAIMVGFSLVYLAWLSLTAFVLTVGIVAIGAGLHFRRAAASNRLLHESTTKENEFFDTLTHLLDGFKEARLHRGRADDLAARLRAISYEVRDLKTRTSTQFAEQFIFGQAASYLLLGALVFVLPRLSPTYSDVVMKSTATVLFIVGPLSSLLAMLPVFVNANVAAENIFSLESILERPNGESAHHAPQPPAAAFGTLRLHDVTYSYEEGFKVGPINLEVASGETLFIVGGNGSGKSTLLKVLTGLYSPEAGTVSIDRTVLTAETAQWHRSHFSAVFSDYHLFDRLYGIHDATDKHVAELLARVGLDGRTSFQDGRFTTLDLSTGQRKRLALVVSLLENRPILVFDELAADQDPAFRKYFYEEMLTELKQQGRTIIAVTHDDRYFSRADRVLKMDYGVFTDYQPA